MIRNGNYLNTAEKRRYEIHRRDAEIECAVAVIGGIGSIMILAAFSFVTAAGIVSWAM